MVIHGDQRSQIYLGRKIQESKLHAIDSWFMCYNKMVAEYHIYDINNLLMQNISK